MRINTTLLLLVCGFCILVASKATNPSEVDQSNLQTDETAVVEAFFAEKEFANGIYKGHLNAVGEREGWGTFTWVDSQKVYVGEWKHGQRHGRGTTKYSNSDQFEGKWMHGKANGHGVFVWADGSCYDGDFKDGKFHGFGVFTAASGNRYVGQYRNGRRHGHGVANMTYGDSYEGYFKNDKYNGRGTYRWADGRQYEGQFKDSELHGNGELVSSDGFQKEVGIWNKGVFQRGRTINLNANSNGSPSCTECADLEIEEVCQLKEDDPDDAQVCQIHVW